METPRGKWQELQRNLGEVWRPSGMWARGVRAARQGVRRAHGCGKSPWGKHFGCRRLLGRVWVGAYQQAANKKKKLKNNNHWNALLVPARGNSGKGKCQRPRQDRNPALLAPGPAPGQGVRVVLLSPFQTVKTVTVATFCMVTVARTNIMVCK